VTAAAAFGRDLWAERPGLVKYALSLCRDAERAEDLASHAIERGWQFRERFEPGTNLRGWLSTILRNRFLSEQRRQRWDGGSVEDIDGLVIPAAPSQEDAIHLRDVEKSFALMPREQVDALIAVALEGTYEDAAVKLGCLVGTVKSRACRGRDALKELTA
jgi:RNA polymerase sigma-70 factor (ECF subfamily)